MKCTESTRGIARTHRTRLTFVLAYVALLPSAWGQIAVRDIKNATDMASEGVRVAMAKVVRLNEPGVLYVRNDEAPAKQVWVPADCQPLKGEQVKVTKVDYNVGGVSGINAARV